MVGRRVDYLLPSLLASFGKNARVTKDGVRFLSEIRPLIDGPAKQVADFTDDEILTGILTRWQRGGLGGTGIFVAHGGGVQSAYGVLRETNITNPLIYLETAVKTLVGESRRLDPADPFRALLGNDLLGTSNPIMLSSGERILRLLEAVVTAVGQATANRLNALTLFDPALLASTLRFVRGHIVRNGMEQGLACPPTT